MSGGRLFEAGWWFTCRDADLDAIRSDLSGSRPILVDLTLGDRSDELA